jgi:CheY-like chemotaxis protein
MTPSRPSKSIVFYADDDIDDIQLVMDAFARYTDNIELITASNGSQAMNYFHRLTDSDPLPCLIILDINMPLVSGKQVLVSLRAQERFKKIPIVLFSTSSLPSDEQYAKQHGAGFISKPLDMVQMEHIASNFLDHCSDEVKQKIQVRVQ